jgi:hypothetical protein
MKIYEIGTAVPALLYADDPAAWDLASSSQPVAFAQLYGAQHAWDVFNSPWTEHSVNAVHSFCKYLHAQCVLSPTANRQPK